ncbi:hypothetical protein [Steroidobacter sp.]|nr:hypothetical protein [Steroidobacter sp.]MBL8270476.1 hypothetical protein [Steroidobacter sp.]
MPMLSLRKPLISITPLGGTKANSQSYERLAELLANVKMITKQFFGKTR